MGQLEEERAELVEWQKLDKARRGLQYAIYDADLADAAEKLQEVCVQLLLANQVFAAWPGAGSCCYADAWLPCQLLQGQVARSCCTELGAWQLSQEWFQGTAQQLLTASGPCSCKQCAGATPNNTSPSAALCCTGGGRADK